METILEQGGSLGVLLIFALLLFREAASFVRGKKNGSCSSLHVTSSRSLERTLEKQTEILERLSLAMHDVKREVHEIHGRP